jgi:pantetheine-phosphate adenylyltransferase
MTTAVYAGSFDPVTFGHLDIIHRAQQAFEKVVVGIGVNSAKKTLFTTEERTTMLVEAMRENRLLDFRGIEVKPFEGLLVNFCQNIGATVIIRGLRAVTDFEYEIGIAHANASQAPNVLTFFLPTTPKYSFVSSSVVRELAKYNGFLDQYVPKNVEKALKAKFSS